MDCLYLAVFVQLASVLFKDSEAYRGLGGAYIPGQIFDFAIVEYRLGFYG